MKTWKIVYNLPPAQQNNGVMGVAFIQAYTHQDAMYAFSQQYAGKYSTIDSCTAL